MHALPIIAVLLTSVVTIDSPSSVEQRYNALVEEYAATRREYLRAYRKDGLTDIERTKIESRLAPDEVAFAKRFLALAQEDANSPIALDSLFFTLQLQGNRLTIEGKSALAQLRRDQVLSPKMDEHLVELSRRPWAEVEPLLREVLEKSPHHTAKAHACFGLARVISGRAKLPKQALDPARARELEEIYGKDRLAEEITRDTEARLREACALYERVLIEFADVKLYTADPLGKQTLGPIAKNWLMSKSELALGKSAPEIEDQAIGGNNIKLSDYRGKVVVLVFWASWCGPCLAQIPHEQQLAAKYDGKPFAILGVNLDYTVDEARVTLAKRKITWPNWYGGEAVEGGIADRYHIESLPAVFVLDAKGVIRERDLRGDALEKVVESLLTEQRLDNSASMTK
ncbi:MAG: resA 7 [Planctomycetota bacterium]|nr:resA 7 [Planctomycetota bacterium]